MASRTAILDSMGLRLDEARAHKLAARLVEAAECINDLKLMHETLHIFDNFFDAATIAYLNDVD
jgi:hypothetical protein